MALTTLTTGMAQADFLSAVNANYAYLVTLCNKVAMSVVTIDDAKVGQPLLDDLNNNFAAYDANYKAVHITLTIGMTNEKFISSLNTNFQAVEDKVNEWSLIKAYINSITHNQTYDVSIIGSTGSDLFAGAAYAPNKKVYAGPYANSGKILIIDTVTNTHTTIGSGLGNTNGAVYYDGYVYFMPIDNTHHVIVLNITTNEITTIGTTVQDCVGAVVGPNGKIYSVTYGAPGQILEIDPVAKTHSFFGSFNGTYRGITACPDGTFIVMPFSGSTNGIMRVSPWTHTITYFGTSVPNGYWGAKFSPIDDLAYSFPISTADSTQVLKINPVAETVTAYGTTDAHLGSCVLPNGKPLAIPYNTGVATVAQPGSNSLYTFQFDAGGYPHKFGGIVLAENGQGYAIPNGFGDIIKVMSAFPVDAKFPLSRFFNAY